MPLKDFAELYPTLTTRLRQARLQDRIAHGYLFVGDSSPRIEAFAAAFMQLCICKQITDDGDACGICQNCLGIANDSYPYLNELRPQSKSRQILIDDVRGMEHFLHLTSGGETRLAVVHDADRMNEQTQNAFLKTLEEPAPRTIIILVTCSPSNLLATIRSRCQIIALHDNRVHYDVYLETDLFRTLASMQENVGALKAANTSHLIRDTLKEIKATFATQADAAFRALKNSNQEYEPAYLKKREVEIKAQQEALYRGERARYLSALHAWFSQEFMRAKGVANDLLPHPEFLSAVPSLPSAASSKHARHALNLVEELIHTLQFNVDESLAIEDFCQTVCAKS